MTVYSFMHKDKSGKPLRIHLIDTPGFDDTNRGDTAVLKDIATWLGETYKNQIRLSGVLYLHRIIDVRMAGSAKRNLLMFIELCGSDCFKHVVLATTMWSVMKDRAEAERREKELIQTFWSHVSHVPCCPTSPAMKTSNSHQFRRCASKAAKSHATKVVENLPWLF